MDAQVCNLLQAWGLASYINTFRANSINYRSMMLLGAAEIRELFPVVGHRVLFTRNLEELRRTRNSNIVLGFETGGVYYDGYQALDDSYVLVDGNVYEDADAVLYF